MDAGRFLANGFLVPDLVFSNQIGHSNQPIKEIAAMRKDLYPLRLFVALFVLLSTIALFGQTPVQDWGFIGGAQGKVEVGVTCGVGWSAGAGPVDPGKRSRRRVLTQRVVRVG